jgi:hypothetical protein
VLVVVLAIAAAAPVRLPPVERCGGDAAFSAVRQKLERIVAKRDFEGLLSLMSEDVRVTFGGRYGRESFRHFWAQSKEHGELWSEFQNALRLGCATAVDGQGKDYRAIPAMFVTGDDLDGFSTWVALPGAIMRTRPNARAAPTMRLPAWTVLNEVEHDGGPWIEARTPKGRKGYVSTAQARSIIDYRIVFGRRDGEWKITAFVAGD